MIALAWIIFIAVVAFVIILNIGVVAYFKSSSRREGSSGVFPPTVAIVSLSLCLLTVLLIPVDIYSVSQTSASGPFDAVKVFYFSFYGGILFLCFFLIPFAYFWYESYDPENTSTAGRCCETVKYSIAFIIIFIILFIVGLIVVKPPDVSTNSTVNWKHTKVWAKDVLGNKGDNALTFAIGCATILGYLVWMTYTAYGLSSLPIGLIRGRLSARSELMDRADNIRRAREERESLVAKETRTRRDERRISYLKDREREEDTRYQRLMKQVGGWRKIFVVCKPFAFVFGILFMLVSILIIVSILLTQIDKVMQDYCGAKCGYFLQYGPKLFNPMDKLLVVVSKYFPTDYVIVGVLAVYIFFCTLSGISNIGIRVLFWKLYNFRKSGTPPQGLFIGAWLLALSTFALNNELLTLTPQYATFGPQKFDFKNGTKVQCNLDYVNMKNSTDCRMTMIAQTVNKLNVGMPFFGVAFYWMTWAFILMFLIGLIVSVCRRKSRNIEEYSDDEFGDEDVFD